MNQRFCLRTLPVVAALTLMMTFGAAAEAQVTILTVGPHGTFANIQGAIDTAVVGDDTEIRVEGLTTYVENLVIPSTFNDGALSLLGGWDMTFANRVYLPPDTILDGNQADRALDVRIGGGSLVLDGFTITNGLAESGAGVNVAPSGDALVTLDNVRILGNTATAASLAMGGGLRIGLSGNGRVELLNSRIKDNQAIDTGGAPVRGGGLDIIATGSSSFLVQGCEIDHNTVESVGGILYGAGINIHMAQSAEGDLLGNSIVENTATGTNAFASAGAVSLREFSILNVERTAFAQNAVTGGGTGPQVKAFTDEDGSLRMSDSIVVLGDYSGLEVSAYGSSIVNLVNLTVADNLEDGIDLYELDMATVTLYNAISFGNLVDLRSPPTLDTGSNLIGVDPLFINPATIDYHLSIDSPAENAGDNSPPGGLGLLDFDGNPRIKNGTVDIGCYEGISEIFINGFESGDTSAWSNTVP